MDSATEDLRPMVAHQKETVLSDTFAFSISAYPRQSVRPTMIVLGGAAAEITAT